MDSKKINFYFTDIALVFVEDTEFGN